MNVCVTPAPLSGSLVVPSSKSVVHRQMICAALADAPTSISLRGLSEDIRATADALRALGAKIQLTPLVSDDTLVEITPVPQRTLAGGDSGSHATFLGQSAPSPAAQLDYPILDCGESGSTARFLLPVAAVLCEHFGMTGHGRLPSRPMDDLCDAMKPNGCNFSAPQLPFTVSGALHGGDFRLAGNVSSQYVTGLLLALPLAVQDSRILLDGPLASAAYVDITLAVQKQFGITVIPTDTGYIVPGKQHYHSPGQLAAEGDWSNAAFWLVADALRLHGQHQHVHLSAGAPILLDGLNPDSPQGDRAITELIDSLCRPGECTVNIDPVPDLMPVLSVLACMRTSRTVFANAARLRLKESDRIAACEKMILALGGKADSTADTLYINGTGSLTGGTVDGCGDHRIVMAAAVASLLCRGEVTILGAEAVQKSYPDFFEDFRRLGGNFHVISVR